MGKAKILRFLFSLSLEAVRDVSAPDRLRGGGGPQWGIDVPPGNPAGEGGRATAFRGREVSPVAGDNIIGSPLIDAEELKGRILSPAGTRRGVEAGRGQDAGMLLASEGRGLRRRGKR